MVLESGTMYVGTTYVFEDDDLVAIFDGVRVSRSQVSFVVFVNSVLVPRSPSRRLRPLTTLKWLSRTCGIGSDRKSLTISEAELAQRFLQSLFFQIQEFV